MLGLAKGEVFLCEYNVAWVDEFQFESERIIGQIGHYVVKIHHIGSTSVASLKAKPIIDIAVEIAEFQTGFECVEALGVLGYKHRIIDELADRHYWSKGNPRTHQIHMFQSGSPYLSDLIKFRDVLRDNDILKIKYEKLKESLVKSCGQDKFKYTKAKNSFINSVLSNKK